MNKSVAFLELKYGNIYGGYPNFYAISEIAFLVFEYDTNKIFLESWINNAPVDIITVTSKTNELGHTLGRVKEVVNMKTRRKRPFDETFKLDEAALVQEFNKLRSSKAPIRNFLLKNFKKYRFRDLIVFDGRRDIFLCERAGANFERYNVIDLQKDLNKETEYLFSLNKLSVVVNFELDQSYIRSNNLEYWLHPIAARQIVPKSAAFDAIRLMMVHNEYKLHHADFLIKAQLVLNKIQSTKA
ncbi:MAG: hypothetical protein KIPDCIKN_04028 [Haliscomenobacter sp.]|nr:hypothetical protein [Haliscomenobacter sp.]